MTQAQATKEFDADTWFKEHLPCHEDWRTVRRYPAIAPDGQNAEVQVCHLPTGKGDENTTLRKLVEARAFYRIVVHPCSVPPKQKQPGWCLSTGTDCKNLAHAIAEAAARGILGWAPYSYVKGHIQEDLNACVYLNTLQDLIERFDGDLERFAACVLEAFAEKVRNAVGPRQEGINAET